MTAARTFASCLVVALIAAIGATATVDDGHASPPIPSSYRRQHSSGVLVCSSMILAGVRLQRRSLDGAANASNTDTMGRAIAEQIELARRQQQEQTSDGVTRTTDQSADVARPRSERQQPTGRRARPGDRRPPSTPPPPATVDDGESGGAGGPQSSMEYLQLELERHGQELELLRRHVQQMNARLSNVGPGQAGPIGPNGYPGQKVSKTVDFHDAIL